MSKLRTRRHRRLGKMRLKSGKKIAQHKSPSGRTGSVFSKRLRSRIVA